MRINPARHQPQAVTLVLLLSLAGSGADGGQRRGGGGGREAGGGRSGGGERVGTAVPRGDGGSPRGSDGGSSRRNPPATGTTGTTGTTTASTGGDGSSTGRDGGSTGSRPREGRPIVGQAEPRDGSERARGGTTILVPGGYYGGFGPWGYGGFGFGTYYGGDWYDPWYGGYPQVYGYGGDIAGALRLKVKPREAEVFVDGYYAGIVDEFDGVFQRLRVEPGPHRVEISADGYEPRMIEIRALPDQTTTYTGTLNKRQ